MALLSRRNIEQEKVEWTARLQEDLRLKRVVLPSLPEVTKRLREAVGDNNVQIRALAQAISGEPLLVTRLMKAGSSALLGLEPASNLETAILRLGLNAVRGLVYNYCLSKLFKERHTGPLRDELRKLWQRATLTGAFAQMIAQKLKIENSYALLAGLVHNVGAMPIIALFSQQRELAGKLDLMRAMINEQQAPLGEMIVRHWGLPEEVAQVPHAVIDSAKDYGTLSDVVRVAILFVNCHEMPGLGVEGITTSAAAKRLKIDAAMAESWLLQARKDMAELHTLLID